MTLTELDVMIALLRIELREKEMQRDMILAELQKQKSICAFCGKEFVSRRKNQKCCCIRCSKYKWQDDYEKGVAPYGKNSN